MIQPMDPIHFKFGGLPESQNPVGWLAVGRHGVHNDGTPLLSPDCSSVEQIEFHGARLKRLIDDAVVQAKRKLPPN
jgi:hypothetical protein